MSDSTLYDYYLPVWDMYGLILLQLGNLTYMQLFLCVSLLHLVVLMFQRQAIQQKAIPASQQKQKLPQSGDGTVASKTYVLGGEEGMRAAAPTNYLGMRDSDDSDDDAEN